MKNGYWGETRVSPPRDRTNFSVDFLSVYERSASRVLRKRLEFKFPRSTLLACLRRPM